MLQDYKLGIRMLLKYPGLTLAGGLALAIAIGLGVGWYDVVGKLLAPVLPLPEGERVVLIETQNTLTNEPERRVLRDFLEWRRELRTVEDLGAYRTSRRNFIVAGSGPVPITVAEITASALRTARVTPLLGRTLLASDEQAGAESVVVLGYDEWQLHLGGRPDAIGSVVSLGSARATVVGIMPEGFAYPVNHDAWMPLQLRADYAPLEGGPSSVIGRLTTGATSERATAEIAVLGRRAAVAFPSTHQHLMPRVTRPGEAPDSLVTQLAYANLPVLLVLLIACTTVGTLVYARTATREAELAMRYALGASRGRILGQLFVEALMLALAAAALGVAAAAAAVRWGLSTAFAGEAPFWMTPGLRFTTILYAVALAVVSAGILGVLPGLKATRRHAQSRLSGLGTGHATLGFGRVWTTAMIAQVAITVMAFPPARGIAQEALRDWRIREAFPAEEYLVAQLGLDRMADEDDDALARRIARTYVELERRVAQEPGVTAVTFGDNMPGIAASTRRAQLEPSAGADPIQVPTLWTMDVGPGFFEAFERPIVRGRAFHGGDRTAGAHTVIVNEAFARYFARLTGGASPVGSRLRYTNTEAGTDERTDSPAQPWFEVVGVVRDIGMTPTDRGEAAFVYHPVAPENVSRLVMGIRVRDNAAALAPRVRLVAAELDPDLRLDELRSLDDWAKEESMAPMVGAAALVMVVSLALFLSASGIFSLMSVSVARRTREIGLRAALGAPPRRVIVSIFTRAAVLVGSGIAVGSGIMLLLASFGGVNVVAYFAQWLLVASGVMLAAGLVACIEPARRALRIQPTDALREA